MFSYQIYKMLHYTGFMLLFFGTGGLLISALSGHALQGKTRLTAFISHGLGMLFLVVGGFGMLARLQLDGIPAWVQVKLIIWLVLGLAIGIAKRRPSWILLVTILIIAMVAPYMAIYKPF